MLEKLPRAIGHALQGLSPGIDATLFHADEFADVPDTMALRSDSFADGGPMPTRHSHDGEGVSPSLAWSGVPSGASELVILVEDADSPTPKPLVHAIVWGLDARDGSLPGGGIAADGQAETGRNSFLGTGWLPPDPPTGHGPHRYVFQIYALDRRLALSGTPGRGALVEAMRGHVVAKGALIGTYERP